jgi:hypothetical protein
MILAVNLLLLLVHTRSTGSPLCNLDIPAISSGMGAPQNLNYKITAIKDLSTKNQFDIRISGPSKFSGLLLYIASAKNPTLHLGNFTLVADGKYKYVESCTTENGLKEATITNKNHEHVPESSFKWQASDAELAQESLTIHAAVVNGRLSWQPLTKILLN